MMMDGMLEGVDAVRDITTKTRAVPSADYVPRQ
jgi:hypothetical protein